jgi:diacylglycerol kinase
MNFKQQTDKQANHSLFSSFGFAFSGLIKAFLIESNLKIHVAAGISAAGLAYWLNFSFIEWAVLIICIGIVIAFELMNTAVELVCNRISTDHHPLTGLIKDLSAAAVLVVSIASAVVGFILFVPKFLDKIYYTP